MLQRGHLSLHSQQLTCYRYYAALVYECCWIMRVSICLVQRKHKALATVLCLGQAILVAHNSASQPLEFDLYNVSNPAIQHRNQSFPLVLPTSSCIRPSS